MKHIIYYPAWIQILMYINKYEDTYITSINMDLGFERSHILDVLNELEQRKLIIRKFVGRRNIINITSKGKEYVCKELT